MGGLFQRLKVWKPLESVGAVDLNAELDNIIANLIPAKIDDYAASVSQFQETQSPGDVGTEVLPTKLSEEIKTLRYQIDQIIGEAQWYSPPAASIAGLNAQFNSIAYFPSHRIQSGRVDANLQPMFLVPSGSARTVTLKAGGSNVDFVAYLAGVLRTFSADLTATSLTLAPSSNNTAQVNDVLLAGAAATKTLGENGSTIPIDTVGSEITSVNGRYCAFKIVHGGNTEYFLAEVDTTNAVLKNVTRGCFFSSVDAINPRIAIFDNDVITLLKVVWVFATYNGSAALDTTYNIPVVSADQPTSPSFGDYWFDLTADTWKKYSGSVYAAVAAIPVGICAQDTANTIVARSADFFSGFSSLNTIELEKTANGIVRSSRNFTKVSVYGNFLDFQNSHVIWDMASDLDSGESDSASARYFLYLTGTGDRVISTVAPHDRRNDLFGFYHPSKPWRSVGEIQNDGSSNFDARTVWSALARVSRATWVRYKTQAGASIGNSGAVRCQYDTKEDDAQGMVTTGSSWRFVAKEDGFYVVAAAIRYQSAAWTAGNFLAMWATCAGGRHQLDSKYIEATRTQEMNLNGATGTWLLKGQDIYIEIEHNRTGGASLLSTNDIENFVNIFLVR